MTIVDFTKDDENQPDLSDEDFKEIVTQVLEDPGLVSDWEYDFIMNVADLEEAAELSPGQVLKLLEIKEKLDE